ncbi:MAG: hypothetical protein AAF628_08365 [Planctomycetota bacterium]
MSLSPMTELEAINAMLVSIGQSPVNTAEIAGVTDATTAQFTLRNTSREVQARGWWFNKESRYEALPDQSGHLVIPSNTASYDPSDRHASVIPRPNQDTMMLFDNDRKSFVFDKPVRVDVVWLYRFDHLPQIARNYIAVRAARTFQAQQVGSQILYAYSEEELREAGALMQREHLRHSDTNIFRGASRANRILHRRR